MSDSIQTVGHCRGLSPSFLFAADTKSEPGKTLVHFVRVESIQFDDEAFKDITFKTLHPEGDPRLPFLGESFTHGHKEVEASLVHLLDVIKIQTMDNEQIPLSQLDPRLTALTDAIKQMLKE